VVGEGRPRGVSLLVVARGEVREGKLSFRLEASAGVGPDN